MLASRDSRTLARMRKSLILSLSLVFIAFTIACGDGSGSMTAPDADVPDAAAPEAGVDGSALRMDAGWDAGWDAGADGGRGYEGECRLVPQAGCGFREACRAWTGRGGVPLSACETAGTLGEGEHWRAPDGSKTTCFDSTALHDACGPGLQCNDADFGCARICVLGGPRCPSWRGPAGLYPMLCRTLVPRMPVGFCEINGPPVP